MNNNVYLVPLSNGTYVPYIEETAPSDKAVLLTREGDYPVLLVGLCFDAYGCGNKFERTIQDRSELLSELLQCGQLCDAIWKLWDYDVDLGFSDDIGDLFDLVYYTRMEAIRGNGAVNCKYDFTDSTSLEEYCVRSMLETFMNYYPSPEKSRCTESSNQIDDLPF